MDLPGSEYLFTLATVTVTYVGLSSLIVVFRQSMGAPLAKYDVFLTRNFLRMGFTAVAGALLPPLAALFGIPAEVVWRAAGLLVAVPVSLFALTYPSRRYVATGQPMPKRIWLDVFILVAAAVILLLNALGMPVRPGPGPYALGVSIILLSSFLAFLHALELLLDVPARPVRSSSQHSESR
jgi:hypothetical protein